MAAVQLLPVGKAEFAHEIVRLLALKNGKLLVRVRFAVKGHALGLECLADAPRVRQSAVANARVKAAGEQRVELKAQQPPFGEQGAALLHQGAKVRLEGVVANHHGFAKQRPAFGAANVEHVAQPGQVRQRDVADLRVQRVAQPRAIHEQRQPVLAAGLGDGLQFGLGIRRAQLAGVRDVDHARLHQVLLRRVCLVVARVFMHLPRGELAVGAAQGQHLVAARFNGAGFVRGHMPGFGGDHALPGPQDAGDDGGVGLCAAHQKVHIGPLVVHGGADFFARAFAIRVQPVACGLLQIGSRQPFHDGRMASGQVVIPKKRHGFPCKKGRIIHHRPSCQISHGDKNLPSDR